MTWCGPSVMFWFHETVVELLPAVPVSASSLWAERWRSVNICWCALCIHEVCYQTTREQDVLCNL